MSQEYLHIWELLMCTAHINQVFIQCSCGLTSNCMTENLAKMVAETHAYPNQEKETNVHR